MKPLAWLLLPLLVSLPAPASAATATIETSSVFLTIPAVAQRADGSLFGVASNLTVTMQTPGTGQVFVSTVPLTQIDMQGSARLAVATAAGVTGRGASGSDFFFSVRTASGEIGGPSAGGAMAVAATALLEGWSVRHDVVMTGMINPDASIGPIGGILQKVEAADAVHATLFLFPSGQETVTQPQAAGEAPEPVDVHEYAQSKFGIEAHGVSDLYEAVEAFTGFRIARPQPSRDPLQDEAYQALTARLSDSLLNGTSRSSQDPAERYQAVQDKITALDRSTVEQQLSVARQRLVEARVQENESKHYGAASSAFQASVSLEGAEAYIAFFEGPFSDVGAYVAAYIDETQRQVGALKASLAWGDSLLLARLDSLGAAETRYLESSDSLASARQGGAQGDNAGALSDASFARVRARSVGWWLEIGNETAARSNQTTVGRAQLAVLVDRYAEIAAQVLQYAGLIVGSDPRFQRAATAAQAGIAAQDSGRLAAALFHYADAIAQSDTSLLAIAGADPVQKRLADVAADAAYQVELAQSEGVPAVYALSLIESAEARRTSDPAESYATYSLARLAARTTLLAAEIVPPPPSVEQVPQASSGRPGLWGLSGRLPVLGAWVALGGILVLIVIVLLAGRPQRPERTGRTVQAPPPPVTPPAPPEAPPAVPDRNALDRPGPPKPKPRRRPAQSTAAKRTCRPSTPRRKPRGDQPGS